MKNWKQPVHEKSDESKDMLRKIISTNEKLRVLFGHLNTNQLEDVIMAMFARDVKAGEMIIRQGETGDNFWIVESGKYDIYVNRKQAPVTESDSLGDKVVAVENGACFGELALMYNAPRAATIVSTSAGRLWGLDALSFKMMLVTAENTKKKQYEAFLQNVDLLKDLNQFERASLSDVLDVVTSDPGQVIMKQGDAGNDMYILESGDAKAMMAGEDGAQVLARHYTKPGEYFGELALLLATPRKASVYAGENGCVLLSVSKAKFDRVLGPIKHRLNVEKYSEYAEIIKAAKEVPDNPSEPTSPVSD